MAGTKILEVRSIVSGVDQEPYIQLWLMDAEGKKGEPLVQMTPEEARHHATLVLGAIEAANTDAFLVSFLKEKLNFTLAEATSVLPYFREWRARGKGEPQ